MCYPMLIAAGLAAAGAASNYAGQKKVIGAREDVANAEGEKQKHYQDQADQVINENLVKQSPTAQNQSLAQTTAERTAALTPSASSGVDLPGAGSAPIEVKSEAARSMSDAIRRGRARLGAQARVGASGQNQFNNRVSMNRGMGEIAQLADFSRGSSGVLPYALQGAENAGAGFRTAADLFNLGSSAVGMYGMTQAPSAPGQTLPATGPAGTNYVPAGVPVPTLTGKTPLYSPNYSPARPPVSLYGGRR